MDRVLARAGVTRPRRRAPRYAAKGVPYPGRLAPEPGTTHQVDLIGRRHLIGGVEVHALQLIDVGSHEAANDILEVVRPPLLARSLVRMWTSVGSPPSPSSTTTPTSGAGSNPRGSASGRSWRLVSTLGPSPGSSPCASRGGTGWSSTSTTVGQELLPHRGLRGARPSARRERRLRPCFHNAHHRYAAHGGASPAEIWRGRLRSPLSASYQPPTRLAAQGRIEVVRYVRSNRRVDLFGKRILVAEEHAHQYVTAIIKVRSRRVVVVTGDGEIIHAGDYHLSRVLR